MSISVKQANQWLDSLIKTFQKIKFSQDMFLLDVRDKLKTIEVVLSDLKDLLNNVANEDQTLDHQLDFEDLNSNLERIGEYGNVYSKLHDIIIHSSTAMNRKQALEGDNRILVGESPLFFQGERLIGTIKEKLGNIKHYPFLLSDKFKDMGDGLYYIIHVIEKIHRLKQELHDNFKEIENFLLNFFREISDGATTNVILDLRLQRLRLKIVDINSKNIEIDYLLNGPQPMDFGGDWSALKAHIKTISKNVKTRKQYQELGFLEGFSILKRKRNKSEELIVQAENWEQELITQLTYLESYIGRYGIQHIEPLFMSTTMQLKNIASHLKQIPNTDLISSDIVDYDNLKRRLNNFVMG